VVDYFGGTAWKLADAATHDDVREILRALATGLAPAIFGVIPAGPDPGALA
jgi:hypothetical protein